MRKPILMGIFQASALALLLSGCASHDAATTGDTASLTRPGSAKTLTKPKVLRGSHRNRAKDEKRDEHGPLASAIDKCTKRMDAVLAGNADAAHSAADKFRADLECRAVRQMVVR